MASMELLRSVRGRQRNSSDLEAPAFVEQLPVAIYACDAHARIRWFNRKAAALWGRVPRVGEVFGGAHRIYRLDGRILHREAAPMASVLRTGLPVHGMEAIIERPDGSRVVVMIHIDPIRDAQGKVTGAINCFHDITEKTRAEAELRDRERKTRDLLNALPAAVYTTDQDGRIVFYNEAAAVFWGRRPDPDQERWCGSLRLLWPDGRAMRHDECPMAVALKEKRTLVGEAMAERPDGSRIPFIAFPTPLRDASGEISGAVNMLVDISERKRAETHQTALLDELNHRVKNTLATVQSLAAQTWRGDRANADVLHAFEGRLHALSKAHDKLSEEKWDSADLRSIARDVCAPYVNDDGRIRISGESVKIEPRTALTLAMIFHELATNAAKYGALALPDGTVTLSWAVERTGACPELKIMWMETRGSPLKTPNRAGFGTRLLERGITQELGGTAEMDFAPSGLRCRLAIPLVWAPA